MNALKKEIEAIRKTLGVADYEPIFITDTEDIDFSKIDPRTVIFIDDISEELVCSEDKKA